MMRGLCPLVGVSGMEEYRAAAILADNAAATFVGLLDMIGFLFLFPHHLIRITSALRIAELARRILRRLVSRFFLCLILLSEALLHKVFKNDGRIVPAKAQAEQEHSDEDGKCNVYCRHYQAEKDKSARVFRDRALGKEEDEATHQASEEQGEHAQNDEPWPELTHGLQVLKRFMDHLIISILHG